MISAPVLSPAPALSLPQGGISVTRAQQAAREFEAVFLSQFTEQMLPQAGAVFGEGAGADVWRSQMADVLARALAVQGVAGLAELIGADTPNIEGNAP